MAGSGAEPSSLPSLPALTHPGSVGLPRGGGAGAGAGGFRCVQLPAGHLFPSGPTRELEISKKNRGNGGGVKPRDMSSSVSLLFALFIQSSAGCDPPLQVELLLFSPFSVPSVSWELRALLQLAGWRIWRALGVPGMPRPCPGHRFGSGLRREHPPVVLARILPWFSPCLMTRQKLSRSSRSWQNWWPNSVAFFFRRGGRRKLLLPAFSQGP